ncbi:MAG TPA: terpene cyclase/mutase family protein [Firmicutes bacterium]|nr:terpene cyclase/mutase family protein [Bacillota bacterium]
MKKTKSLLASLLAVSVMTAAAVPALAAGPAAPSAADRLESAMEYMRDNYADDFEAGLSTANMWTLLCALGADKAADPDYAFLLPSFDVAAMGEETSLSQYATTIISLELMGENPADMDGKNLVEELAGRQNEDGSFTGAGGNDLPFVIGALNLAGADYDADGALASLEALRKADGGYSWDNTAAVSNVDTSGLALIGLTVAEGDEAFLEPTIAYLDGTLNEEGCFVGEDTYAAANSCSQATALAGLSAAGVDLSAEKYAPAVAAFYEYQTEDGGFVYDAASEEPDFYSTYQGVLALIGLLDTDVPAGDASSDAVTEGTSDSAAPDSADGNETSDSGNAEQTSADADTSGSRSNNHKTSDPGLNPLIIVALVVAVAAVAACIIVPMVKKKKTAAPTDEGDDENTPPSES